jgi:CRP-like cAMP-binding protein
VYLEHIGVAQTDLLYVFLTHIHADHDGGLIEKLLSGSRTTVIAADVVFRSFVHKAQLVTGHDFQQENLVEHISANPGRPVLIELAGERIELETRWNLHPIPTHGFKLTLGGESFGYSADTQYDPALICQLQGEKRLSQQQVIDLLYFFWTPDGTPQVDLLFHEAGIPPIHTDRQKLELLPEAMQAKTALVHIADRDVPPGARLAKPPLFTTHTLLPATEQSHQGSVLRTLALVSYLYDIPSETLKGLADRAYIRVFERDAVIIQAGPVKQGETLNFFVVADGEVAVKDGRRLITKLIKADSFGEWGISHQRGFRSADVVASRRTQLIELDEAAYHWMVTKHPVIQARIGKIRTLVPRLQLAQARAVRKTKEEPQRIRSVIEDMNTTQLSAFAVFSEVKRFDQGMPVVIEREAADGFYILLSGYLRVITDGIVVGELSEGDVFGEMGLIEDGKRMATIEVISADAEVLYMSQQAFDALLQTVPAFSFELRVTAAQRHEQDHT